MGNTSNTSNATNITIIQRNGSNNMTKSPNRTVSYIVEHYTAGTTSKNGSARGNADWFNNVSAQASADFIVDDNEIVQFNGDILNQYCWAVGGNKYSTSGGSLYGQAKNANCISIEICSNNKTGKMTYANDPNYYFTDASINNAITLTKYLMTKYSIPTSHVIRHYDVNGKQCPGIVGWNKETGSETEWERFKTKIGDKSSSTSTNTGDNTGSTNISYYRVRKTWADSASQLGAYTSLENAKNNCPSGYSVYDENGKMVYRNNQTSAKPNTGDTDSGNNGTTGTTSNNGTQPSDITGNEAKKASQLLELVHKCDSSGILYSVTTAQMILESGYVTTDLATNACNCFGMKCSLSGNTWSTVWDGKSKYTKKTAEQDANGNTYYITADFRKYPNLEKSIQDHACYLTGAKNGSKLRYDGLTKCTDYKSAITLIKNGGYATDTQYVSKVCNIILKYGLDKYDDEIISKINSGSSGSNSGSGTSTSVTPYRVATNYSNGTYSGQVGAYDILDNAKNKANSTAKENKQTYHVYDNNGSLVYTAKYESSDSSSATSYQVKVERDDLRIRKEATTSSDAVGYIKQGIYTIIDEKPADGYTWGKLKSGVGWIALKYVTKI